ncbi:MCP four helix bundle domain-containing protein [Flavobacterium selenitireducens]|uniref:MCP four helix bundle domain-containing protein n=1 Tax=Flavobacterium selenitireducens TaxID=2722704 RepID=UPI00168AFAA8|nr:MCP four helix bundle domain-containing protein [Flavobacterium selenitireducens]MBD3581251.1 hypothetical protein [Flavobacterium selenitireducens]
MKGLQIIQKKLTASVFLLVVFSVLIVTNQAEKRHSNQISQAASSLYKDRLVVESYIFQYYRHLHHIKETVANGALSESAKIASIQTETSKIAQLDALYLKTVLTKSEQEHFSEFHKNCAAISGLTNSGNLDGVAQMSTKSLDILDALSAIQLSEGQVQIDNVGKITSASSLYSQLEMGMLVVVALIIQSLVFTSRKFKESATTRMSLN